MLYQPEGDFSSKLKQSDVSKLLSKKLENILNTIGKKGKKGKTLEQKKKLVLRNIISLLNKRGYCCVRNETNNILKAILSNQLKL